MAETDLPIIRLKPKAAAQAIRHGYPWIYDNEIVTDRRTRKLPAGAFAILQDEARRDMALVTVNPASRIFARVLDQDVSAKIDRAWMEKRVRHALSLRDRLYSDPYYRLIHAEADGFPGVVVDRFGEALVIQPNAAWAELHLDDLVEVLSVATGATTIVKNAAGRARALEGLDDASSLLRGQLEGPVEVPMNGATYLADLQGGQKTGLFYDQRPNHAFAKSLAKDARVLDVFSHVGGFGLAALTGGAVSTLAVDASAPALALASQGAARMGVADRFATRKEDAFDALEALSAEGASFDLVICDPPAFAPSRKALEAGLRAYERIARLSADCVAPGGYLVLCSCSHAADLTRFRQACIRGIGRAGRTSSVIYTGFAGPDHPQHPQLAESGYLKALAFRLL